MKIYVITKGEYSDYHICAVTDDPVSAKNLRRYYSDRWDDAEIEEFDTEQMPDSPKQYWYIVISAGGAVRTIRPCYIGEYTPKINQVSCDTNWSTHQVSSYSINVIAKDKEHALKIAFDKIAEYQYYHMDDQLRSAMSKTFSQRE